MFVKKCRWSRIMLCKAMNSVFIYVKCGWFCLFDLVGVNYRCFFTGSEILVDYTNSCSSVFNTLIVSQLSHCRLFILGLLFSGLGYRLNVESDGMLFKSGFKHLLSVSYADVFCISFKHKAFYLFGSSAAYVGRIGLLFRLLFVLNPYKSRGIRFVNEYTRLRVGKAVK